MAGEEFVAATVVMLFMFVFAFTIYARRYKRVGPNEAMVVYGRKFGDRGFTTITGGGKFISPLVEQVKFLDLSLRTIHSTAVSVTTRSGVPVTVDWIGQVKISNEKVKLTSAAEQLLDKTPENIAQLAEATLAGVLRGTCATLEVEQVNADRESLGFRVREAADPELGKMGLEVISVLIKDVQDQVGYIEALGKKRTAEVKRDAIVAEATIRRDTVARAAEIDVEAQRIRFDADQAIAREQLARDEAIAKMRREAEEREPGLKRAN